VFGAISSGKPFLLAVLLWSVSVLPAAAGALLLHNQDAALNLVPHLMMMEDDTARLGIADVISPMTAMAFAPARESGDLNLGYSHSAWWFRVVLEAEAAAVWYLEIGYPALDTVELFIADGDAGFRRWSSGDHVPFNERPFADRNLVFPLSLPAGTTTAYLRICSEGTLTVPVLLWPQETFHRHSKASYAGLALYYGILLALGAYNLLLYFSLREKVYLDYILFLSSMALAIGSLNGFASEFAWPGSTAWGNVALPLGMALSGLFAARFARTFLDTPHTAPLIDRMMVFFIAWFAMAIAINLVSYQLAEQLTSIGGGVFSFVAWAGGVVCLRKGHPGARYFLLAWTILLLGSILLAARNFDWVPTNFITVYGFQIGSALEMILLSFALADRINALRHDHDETSRKLLEAQAEMVNALRQSEHELEAKVQERTAELNEANLRLEAMARCDPLTGIGNRNELEISGQGLLCRKPGHRGVAVILMDLNEFKPINDSHGHEVGDLVLRVVAQRLRSTIRETDVAVRLGGDEFVLLVDDVDSGGMSLLIDKIQEATARPIQINSLSVTVGVSVGAAHYPEDGTSLGELLKMADDAMYREKAGRGAAAKETG
jgi:diguanylate cyclase (GGDEF)-like protein